MKYRKHFILGNETVMKAVDTLLILLLLVGVVTPFGSPLNSRAIADDDPGGGAEQMQVSLKWTSPPSTSNPANTRRVSLATAEGSNIPDTRLEYTPEVNEVKSLTFQLVFSLPPTDSTRIARPGELEARIPRYIMTARDGTYVVNTIAAPNNLRPTTTEDNCMANHSLVSWNPLFSMPNSPLGLQARIEYNPATREQEIVIWNVETFDVGNRVAMDVIYSFIPGNIQNGFSRTVEGGNAIYATASYIPKLRDGAGRLIDAMGNIIQVDYTGAPIPGSNPVVLVDGGFTTKSNPLELVINTFVRQPYSFLSGIVPTNGDAKYEYWQESWMPASSSPEWSAQGWGGTLAERDLWRKDPSRWPANAPLSAFDPGEYFYIIYRLRYCGNLYASTQPFDLHMSIDEAIIADQGGEILGYIGSNNNSTVNENHAFSPFLVQTQAQRDAAALTWHFPSNTTNALRYWHRHVLVRYKREDAELGIRLNFEASMLTTGIDNHLDESLWSNFATNPLLAPPTNANSAAIAALVTPRPNSYTWQPQEGMNNQAKYTHRITNQTSYLYTGVHFSYGGGNYSTVKAGEWERDYQYPRARFFTGINRLEEGLPLVLRRNATGAFSYSFYTTGTARGWHLTRVSGLISIPTDIIWLAESWTRDRVTNDWRKGDNLDWITDSEEAVLLSPENGWWAIKAGKTLDPEYTAGTNPLCVYYELFEVIEGTVYPLGFVRLAETT
ncbi:MAG: hypothetical protein FWE76_02145, partial [Symbiobacteriaceae bacterium]|nr:hypothetical protein [Symbiobacteriaceae bacterium]